MDLRGLFTEMCDGGSKRSGSSSTETLSSSCLARGLKHAGLPLDRALVNLLVAAFSTSTGQGRGRGDGGGRGSKHHYVLSYADFHRMVHCDGLLAGGSGAQAAGGGGPAATLDEQVRNAPCGEVEGAVKGAR